MYRMNTKLMAAVAVLLLAAPFTYAREKKGKNDKTPAPAAQTAPPVGTPAAKGTAPANPYFNGDGGRGKSITILPPRGASLAANQAYLPDLVANELVSNFKDFSAMTLFDRVNNQKQYDELLSGFYADDDKAGLDLGHLASTDYMLLGTITRTSTGYALQLTVNSNSDKTTAAAYSGTILIAELDNLTGVRRASLDLLQKIGVQITAQGRTELTRAESAERVNAQTAMAQGIVAQRGGTVIEALSHFIQANNYDTSIAEAASRLNILTANIASGNIGENVRNDIAWRDQWVARLKECEAFYANYLKETPPYYLVYSPNIKQGAVDYDKRTVELTVESIAAYPDIAWFSTVHKVVQTVQQGLMATKRADVWKLDKWPQQSVSAPNPFVNRYGGFYVEVEILNSEGKSIAAKETVSLPTGWEVILDKIKNISSSNSASHYGVASIRDEKPYYIVLIGGSPDPREIHYAMPIGGIREIVFPSANPDAITDNLSIRITSIDGIPAETAARQKRINILTAPQYAEAPNAKLTADLKANQQNSNWSFFSLSKNSDTRSRADRWSCYNSYTGDTSIAFINYSAFINHGATSINNGEFSGLNLISVTIPNGVTTIGRSAFENCYLTSVTIPNSVTRIGEGAFAGNQLTSVTIPNSVTTIDERAFSNNQLTSVTIPNSVTRIDRWAFRDNPVTSITIGANVGLHRDYPGSFPHPFDISSGNTFDSFYNNNGKKAGTYTYNESSKTWSYRAR